MNVSGTPGTAWRTPHVHTGMRRDQRGYPDYPAASFPSHSRENLSCLSIRSDQKNQTAANDDSELTIVRIIRSNSAIPAKTQRSKSSLGVMAAWLVRSMEWCNECLPVGQNYELLVLVDGWIREGAFGCGICLRHGFKLSC